MVRAPDPRLKGRRFESLQERRENSLLRGQLSVLTLFRYPFHPRAIAIARKRSRSFCQKCRWQVTAKHAHITYVALHEVTRSMVVWRTQDLRRDGSSFMWHQPCQCCKYTTAVDKKKKKKAAIKLVTHVEPHASAVSLLKRAKNSAI